MAQVLTSEGMAEGKAPETILPDRKKPVEKVEVKAEPKVEPSVDSTKADETEDDQGLTPAERTAYSEKIARKISAKHRALKQAEAAAGKESQGRQAAEKEASDLRKEIAELKKSTPVDDGKGPQRKDFASDADWWDAKIDWKAEQKAEAKFTALEAKRETERIEAEKSKRIAAFAETVDDYDETVEAINGAPQHQAVLDYIGGADLGPHLIYYYGKHPDEYEALSKMKAVQAVAMVGKTETKLEKKAEKVEPKKDDAKPDLEGFKAPISRAPAPIQPLNESATPVQKDPSKMEFHELRAYNRAQRMKQVRG